jgi:hypothetical protein
MGNSEAKTKDLTNVGGETIVDIKNGVCLIIACCDCKLTHRFIKTLRRGATESGDRAALSISTDLKMTDSLRNGL